MIGLFTVTWYSQMLFIMMEISVKMVSSQLEFGQYTLLLFSTTKDFYKMKLEVSELSCGMLQFKQALLLNSLDFLLVATTHLLEQRGSLQSLGSNPVT